MQESLKEAGSSRSKKLFFFGFLFILFVILIIAIFYKLGKKSLEKPSISNFQSTHEASHEISKAEAIKVLKEKTTPAIKNLLDSKNLSLEELADGLKIRSVSAYYQITSQKHEISRESYHEWIDQLASVNLANAREFAESFEKNPPSDGSPEYNSIKEKALKYFDDLRWLNSVYLFSRQEGPKNPFMNAIVIAIGTPGEIVLDWIEEMEEKYKNDPEKLKIDMTHLFRALSTSITLINILLPFNLEEYTEEILANHCEIRDYIASNLQK
jgi:hypothetical protein